MAVAHIIYKDFICKVKVDGDFQRDLMHCVAYIRVHPAHYFSLWFLLMSYSKLFRDFIQG